MTTTISTTLTAQQDFAASGEVITVTSSGAVKQTVFGAAAIYGGPGIDGTLLNSGTLTSQYNPVAFHGGGYVSNNTHALIAGENPVYFMDGGAGTVVNAGDIRGISENGILDHVGIWFTGTGFASNASTGTITSAYGIYAAGAATVVNAGTIAAYTYEGVWLKAGGTVTNLSGGTITSGSGTGVGVYSGIGVGVVIGYPGHASGAGLITNAGTISSSIGAGAELADGGTITNNGSGLIKGTTGIVIQGAGATITNAATIDGTGGTAVSMATGVTNRLIVDPGAKFIGTANGGTAADATLELASGASQGTLSGLGANYINFHGVTFDPSANWLVSASSTAVPNYTFASIGTASTIDVTGFTATSMSTLAGGTGLVLNNGANHVTLHFSGTVGTHSEFTTGTFGTEVTDICFCRGTRIMTPEGEVPVESLAVGDLVVTLGHATPRKIVWIGKGNVLATRGKRGPATPVIVRRGALADGVPNQDLHVTRAHSLYIDGVLIPVEFLVNHKSILWDDRAQEVEIYHVELESHDVLIANGAPAESYRDDGNRWLFQNANSGWGLPPQEPFAPVMTAGSLVDDIWRRLLGRAGARYLLPLTDDPDLHLIVDGARIEVTRSRGAERVFQLPARPTQVVVASRDAVPTELGLARDPRSLGVALRHIALWQGARCTMIQASDERLRDGFHGYEPEDDLRWTNGSGALPGELFASFGGGGLEVVLVLAGATQYVAEGARVLVA